MKKAFLSIIILSLVALTACTQPVDPIFAIEKSESSLKQFSSVDELKDYLGKESFAPQAVFRSFGTEMAFAEAAVADTAVVKSSANEFSETNVQVQGVDEADIVKNDGKYIYTLVNDRLVIVDAFPADSADIVSQTLIDGNPVNIFVNEDKLVVFSNVHEKKQIIPEFEILPQERYAQTTHAYVYDISDRTSPKLIDDISIDGGYFQARMIGDVIYAISRENVYYYQEVIDMPVVRTAGDVMSLPVFYFDNPSGNYVFHTIASIDLDSEKVEAESYLLGYSTTLYVSERNLYLSYQQQVSYEDMREDRFENVLVPLLPANVKARVNAVDSWEEKAIILEDMYGEMSESERELFAKEVNKATEEYQEKLDREQQKTIIHKFSLDDGDIEYVSEGIVEGTLLNQFSLDEFEGNLRVATTSNLWRSGKQFNNVFVLDQDLDTIGSLTELAHDERIFSTRFMGDKLYMVTFKRIDPLFVISLEDPRNPKVLGELKIPGFSDYLHPYDENHIIGVGKETKENEWGGVSTQGVKLALFDVSDVTKPRQVDSLELGQSGSDSEVLRDHKAFLFDRQKDILVLPIREVQGEAKYVFGQGYTQQVWQGAYIFGIDPDEGFNLKGKVSHFSGSEDQRYYWSSPYAIRRSLYMDDVLYTVSSKSIVMNDLDTLEEVGEVNLPFKEERYPVWY